MGPCPQLRYVALWSGAVIRWWSHPLAPASDLTVCCLILETFLPLSGVLPFIWVPQNHRFLTGFPPWRAVPTWEALSLYPVHSLTGPLTQGWTDVLSIGLARGGGRHGSFSPSTQHPARRMQGDSLMSEHMDCLVSLRQEEGLHCCVSLSLHVLVALIFTVWICNLSHQAFKGLGVSSHSGPGGWHLPHPLNKLAFLDHVFWLCLFHIAPPPHFS